MQDFIICHIALCFRSVLELNVKVSHFKFSCQLTVLTVFNTSALLTIPWWIWKAGLFPAFMFVNVLT